VPYIIIKEQNVTKCNEIVKSSDSNDDVLLLCDYVELHGDIIDIMTSCLYAADKHAIVCGQDIDNNTGLIETAYKYLPEYSLTDKVNASCALIKRSVINNMGFLDESFEDLQEALSDFYHRINVFGFSAIVSFRVLFSYNEKLTGNKSEKELMRLNSHTGVSFLKVLDENYYPKKRILFDCAIMPAMHCGTSEYQKAIFEAFNRLFGNKYDIYLYVGREAAEFHGLFDKYDNVICPDTMKGDLETFHLGYAPNQLMHIEHQLLMSKSCVNIVQTMFDIMMIRIDEHIGAGDNAGIELGVRLCDGIVFISEFTKNDTLAYFPKAGKSDGRDDSIHGKKLKVIYPSAGIAAQIKDDYEAPFEEYFLVIGNYYRHKAIKETIEVISNLPFNFIVVGYGENEFISPNIYNYKSGQLEDEFLHYLYSNCRALIFPSLYEGFGIPLADGLKNNKRVIVNKNALNKELQAHFNSYKDCFFFFDRFEQIPEIINTIDFSKDAAQTEFTDTWDRAATELEMFFEEILNTGADKKRLNQRWLLYNALDEKMKSFEKIILDDRNTIGSLREELKHVYGQFGDYGLLHLIKMAFKKNIRHKHPGLFKLLGGK